ncbi:MAG: NUDIX domain-containing protein [Eubacteriales bacterium]|nr:NUDIX domain-containing protein [Eubacteriales bacterium]
MEFFIDLKDYNKDGSVFKRTASRCIIKRGDKYLLIHSKYGEYKFPGGGVEKGETLEQAVIREVKEETGYTVIPSSLKHFGVVHEKRKGMTDDICEMDSHYFFGDAEDIRGKRSLDEYEEEYNYLPGWFTLEEAIGNNSVITEINTMPWIVRDTEVMKYIKGLNNKEKM